MNGLSGAQIEGLLKTLYQGPLETPPWSSFLDKLRATIAADYVSLAFRPLDAAVSEAVTLFSSSYPRPDLEHDLIERLYRESPLPYLSMKEGVVRRLQDMLDPNVAAHVAFVDCFLRPRGLNHVLVLRVQEPGGANAWLAVSRRDEPFDSDAEDGLLALHPHLAIATQYLAELERERRRSAISADVARRLDLVWVTFDKLGELIDMDARAGELLKKAGVLVTSARGSPRLTAPHNGESLEDALAAAIADGRQRPRAVHLADSPWLDMLVLPISQPTMLNGRIPVAVGYVHGDVRSSLTRREQLCELFGMTSSEAGLALALCNGRSIAEAAEAQGLTIETARSYSKRLYSKTGAKGQADLVRLILRSVIALV